MTAYWEIELMCLQCARPITVARVLKQHDPIPYSALSQRCEVCGGQPIRSGEQQKVVQHAPLKLADIAPRHGRPPRWLVEERRKEQATA